MIVASREGPPPVRLKKNNSKSQYRENTTQISSNYQNYTDITIDEDFNKKPRVIPANFIVMNN